MGDLGCGQNEFWRHKQLSDNAHVLAHGGRRATAEGVRYPRVGTRRSHLNSWLFWTLLSAACGEVESLKQVSVSATPKDAGELADAAADDAAVPGVCTLPADQVSSHKECSSDADCEAVTYRPDCCATEVVVGVEASFAPQVRDCPQATQGKCKSCGKKPTRADDGRIVADADVVATCVEGACRTAVTTRNCGNSLRCRKDELCVTSQKVPGSVVDAGQSGDNALFSYSCVANPCMHGLDCKCAQALCDRSTDAIRRCDVDYTNDADVTCSVDPR